MPLDPGYAAIALETTSAREEIFELLLRGARARTRFAAVMTVHGDHFEVRRVAAAEGIRIEGLDALAIPRTVTAFESAIKMLTPMVAATTTGEPFVDGMVEMLGGAAPMMLAAPIVVEGRPAALLVAHRGRATFGLDDVEELMPLVDAAGDALTRGLRARTRVATVATEGGDQVGEDARRRRASTIDARAERADSTYDVEIIVGDPEAAAPTPDLESLRANGAWSALADALRDSIAIGIETGTPDEDEQLELLVELGEIEAEKLKRPARAIEAWQSALTIDGGDTRAQQALYDMFAKLDRWGECAALLEQRVAIAELPSVRIGLLLELAQIGYRLGDDERAITAYERILHWEPDHPIATEQLEALYTARRQWEPMAEMLLDRAERASGDVAIDALEQVARLYEERLSDPHAALLVWMTVARKLQTVEPLNEVARLAPKANAWDEVIAEGGGLAEDLGTMGAPTAAIAWSLVGEWSRDRGAGDPAVRAFERAIHLETDRSRRCEIAVALGQLAEAAGDGTRATRWYETAIENEPDARAPLLALHRLYRARRAWEPLAELLPRIAAVDPATAAERAAAVALHVERGKILANRLGRHDDAAGAFRAALQLDPNNLQALQGVARASAATGHTEMMLEAAEAALAASETSPDPRRALGDPDQSGAFVDGRIVAAAVIPIDPAARTAKLGEIAAGWYDLGHYERAAAAWQRQLAAGPDPVAQERLAECLDRHVGDVEGAIAAYIAVVETAPAHRGALDALARLYDQAGHAEETLEILRRLLELTATQPRARADVFQRMASVYSGAGDHAAARLQLVQALALDLENAAAHEGMARVHLAQDELVLAGESFAKAASLSATTDEQMRRLIDAAWVFQHRAHDVTRAKECLEQVLALDPDHRDAKQALAGLLADTRRWSTLRDHLAPELARARRQGDAALPAAERHAIFMRAAHCALELDEQAEALELYDRACEVEPPIAARIERAGALVKCRQLPRALEAYGEILDGHDAELDQPQRIAIYRQLGAVLATLGKRIAARPWHLKILELDPGDVGALADLADIAMAQRQFDEAIAHLRAIVALVPEGERVAFLEKIGDLYRDQLDNPPRALSAYLDALEHDPSNRRLLQRVLDVQTATGQWRGAVDTIGKFLDHETDPAKRAAYHLAEAEIRRVELKDKPTALAGYDRALDELLAESPLSPATRTRALQTFRMIDELLTADRDWPELEQAYLRMVKRVPEDRRLLVVLWHALGEIYRSRLVDREGRLDLAVDAFEVAQSIDHSDERASILAELYERTGKQPRTPDHSLAAGPAGYRERMHAAIEANKIDEAWCAARALVVSKQATEDETALYDRFKAHEGDKATGVLDATSWHLVRHPDEDVIVSAIFASIWQGPVALLAGPTKTFDLKPRERMPVEDGTRVIAKLFRHAARVLDTTLPEVYVQSRRPGRLLLANCVEKGRLLPAVIVGRDLMAGYRDTELAAAVGSMLALLRPSYYLRLTLPADDLLAVFAAAATIGGRPELLLPASAERTATFATEIERRLTNTTRIQLHDLIGRLTEPPDLARWCEAVDMTAHRAGLLVCGELAAALRMLSTGSGAADGSGAANRTARRVSDLIAYSASAPYFAARVQLGVTVA